MATTKQRQAARQNIKKAQSTWDGMDRRQRAKAQPEGRARADIGTKGTGDFYRIDVRSKRDFTTFRYHDVGSKGHLMRLSGKRPTGSWGTAAWLVEKGDAHVQGNKLVPDTRDARSLFSKLGAEPKRVKGDVFEAPDRRMSGSSSSSRSKSGSSSRSRSGSSSSSRSKTSRSGSSSKGRSSRSSSNGRSSSRSSRSRS